MRISDWSSDVCSSDLLEAGGIVANDHVLRPNASAEWSRRSGDHRLDAALEIKTEIDDDTGTGRVAIYAPGGALVDRARRRQWEVAQTLSGRGNWEAPVAGGTLSAIARSSIELKTGELGRALGRESVWKTG